MDWSSVSAAPLQDFKDINGKSSPLEYIYKKYGITMLRQRLWAGTGPYDLEHNLALAKRVKRAGLKLYLDPFFSDTWTDPQHIDCYKPWGKTVPEISRGIYDHFKTIGDSFARQGTIPEYISLGNEIISGVCSVGKMSTPNGPVNTAIFLQSAANGIRDSGCGGKSKLMIHPDGGEKLKELMWFFDALQKTNHLDFKQIETIGVSFYPYYQGRTATQGNLARSINAIKKKYRKQVMIVESGWPQSCSGTSKPFPADTSDMKPSVKGQADWISMCANTAKSSGATSIAYWEGAWLDNPGLGSHCDNVLLFEKDGTARPSLAAFGMAASGKAMQISKGGLKRRQDDGNVYM